MPIATPEDIEMFRRQLAREGTVMEQKLKIVDVIGNSLKPGRMLRWQPDGGTQSYFVKAVEVVAPTKELPGRFVFAVMFGIEPQTREQGAIQFKDFVTVMDPEEELKAEAAVARATEGNVRSMGAR